MEDITNNKKCTAIIKAAKDLFWKYGFRRVTIEEICREAKTSKMTFYRFFPNKLELARAVFDQESEGAMLKFRKILEGESSPSEKMKKMLQLKLEGSNNISTDFLNDFYNNPELGLKTHIEERTKALWGEIIELFKVGQNEGWIRKNLKVEFIFYFMLKSSPLITDEELLKLYDSPQDLIMELANMFAYGMSPAKE